jgi:TRAP-type C4-dicarboxylate transport system permease small subunit
MRRLAAMKTTTTTHLTPRRAARWLNQMPPTLSFAIALFFIAGGIASIKGLRSAYETVAVPTPMLWSNLRQHRRRCTKS